MRAITSFSRSGANTLTTNVPLPYQGVQLWGWIFTFEASGNNVGTYRGLLTTRSEQSFAQDFATVSWDNWPGVLDHFSLYVQVGTSNQSRTHVVMLPRPIRVSTLYLISYSSAASVTDVTATVFVEDV